ncbi:Low molecular weight phosphotyrosine protein phosphatase [Pseudovibrio sp. Ad13]|uniref:arsenate-mycothiol transferase ArsC n=1 Tax=unclassified Pseudovibrio TaxID=2627060 RepID=UPI0007AE5170|nr:MULTISPECIES: hypothetical protein [unclassified Pseudovibrio]KZK87352.1 Low molecular weight phosphotyrosine protein phosphatase [Pseudovibrio sp. Ad13]KZL19967.1 Low molecular weight phosphotyrosine protein phosphatase [Pseudovibrio sp. WM33]
MTKANVLFVCVDNSFLSLAAEAYLNQTSMGELRAFSGGPLPREEMVSLTKKVLFANGMDEGGLHPKPWTIFSLPHAPQPDYIIRLQTSVLLDKQPMWPGHPVKLNWDICLDEDVPRNIKEATDAFRKIKESIDLATSSKVFSSDSLNWRAAC